MFMDDMDDNARAALCKFISEEFREEFRKQIEIWETKTPLTWRVAHCGCERRCAPGAHCIDWMVVDDDMRGNSDQCDQLIAYGFGTEAEAESYLRDELAKWAQRNPAKVE